MHRGRRFVLLITIIAVACATYPVGAAQSFAHPDFQRQWQGSEALIANFWGPLDTALDGRQEPYADVDGGSRLVQYFDKGRMELTNGKVTNGLLATELITGELQLGDGTFATRQPATVPVAGDSDSPGPTYETIANAAPLRAPAQTAMGAATTRALAADGTLTTFPQGGDSPQAAIASYDAVTQHNVPAAFAAFRDRAGVLTVGFAISEPFWSRVKVAGRDTEVLVQAFERRVLTFTPANPAAFQVEFGNIGRHYIVWRNS